MTTNGWFNTNLVRLHKAVLCANCEVISEGLNGHCAACGSEALLALSRVLGEMIEFAEPMGVASTQISATTQSGYFSAAA